MSRQLRLANRNSIQIYESPNSDSLACSSQRAFHKRWPKRAHANKFIHSDFIGVGLKRMGQFAGQAIALIRIAVANPEVGRRIADFRPHKTVELQFVTCVSLIHNQSRREAPLALSIGAKRSLLSSRVERRRDETRHDE